MNVVRLAGAIILGVTTLCAMPDVAPAVAADPPGAASMQPAGPAKAAGGAKDSNRSHWNGNASNGNASNRHDANRNDANRNASNRNVSGPGLGAATAGNANERNVKAPAAAVRGPVGPLTARPRAAERVRSNSERLRSLSNQQARARGVAPNRYSDAGSRGTAAAATPLAAQARGQRGANPVAPKMALSSSPMRTAQGSKSVTANANARATAPSPSPGTATAATRGLSIGGVHGAGIGRLGGPVSRNARNLSLDGTQVRRKF